LYIVKVIAGNHFSDMLYAKLLLVITTQFHLYPVKEYVNVKMTSDALVINKHKL